MKIAIVGPGAMGTLFGAYLARAGHQVWFLDRSPARAAEIERQGVHVYFPDEPGKHGGTGKPGERGENPGDSSNEGNQWSVPTASRWGLVTEDGKTGTSGASGTSGSSGTSGISSTSGATGTSGASSSSGTSSASGASGTSGTSGWAVPVRACASADLIGFSDLVFIWVKAYDTPAAAEAAAALVGPETMVITLQNGLGNAEILVERFGPERVLAGVTSEGATSLGPGRVLHAGRGETTLGPWTVTGREILEGASGPGGGRKSGRSRSGRGPTLKTAQEVTGLLTEAGLPCRVTQDVQAELWGKLLVNAAINPLTALVRCENGRLLEIDTLSALLEMVAIEAAAVAKAAGARLSFADPVARVREVALRTARNRSSMLQDVEAGRRTEIEQINGAIVERGDLHGVGVPVNRLLTLLVKSLITSRDVPRC